MQRRRRAGLRSFHEGIPAGKGKLSEILANDGADDFQRCIYFCLAGRGVVAMLDDLEWLEDLLERRGRVAGLHHGLDELAVLVAGELPDRLHLLALAQGFLRLAALLHLGFKFRGSCRDSLLQVPVQLLELALRLRLRFHVDAGAEPTDDAILLISFGKGAAIEAAMLPVCPA